MERNARASVLEAEREPAMIKHRLTLALLLVAAAPTALGQTAVAPPNVTAANVITTPLSQLNITKNDIPPVLLTARGRPYDLSGLGTCRAIQNEVGALNAVLGDDIDISSEKSGAEKLGNEVGSIAKSVITSFIPFNGAIREVSGAATSERQWQVALYAGASRRAFLKGYGQARGCSYPARAAAARDAAQLHQIRSDLGKSAKPAEIKPEVVPSAHRSSAKTRSGHR